MKNLICGLLLQSRVSCRNNNDDHDADPNYSVDDDDVQMKVKPSTKFLNEKKYVEKRWRRHHECLIQCQSWKNLRNLPEAILKTGISVT